MTSLISFILILTLFQSSFSQWPPKFVNPDAGLTPIDDFQNDADGQDALDFAVQQIGKEGIEAKVFPANSIWSVAQVFNASKDEDDNYAIRAQLIDQMNDKVNVSLVVSEEEDGTWNVLSYAYFYNLQHNGTLDDWGRGWKVVYKAGNPPSVGNVYNTIYDAAEFALVPNEWVKIPYSLFEEENTQMEQKLRGPRFFALNEAMINGSIPYIIWGSTGLVPEAYEWHDPVNGTTAYHAGYSFYSPESEIDGSYTAIAYYSFWTSIRLEHEVYEHWVVLYNNTETESN